MDFAARGLARGARTLLGRRQPSRVAFMGDSITAQMVVSGPGTGSVTDGFVAGSRQVDWSAIGWFTHLQHRIGHRFNAQPSLNKGIGGNTTNQMAARFDADIAANYAAFDILVMGPVGTNDGPASITKETTLANIQAMAGKALAAGKAVVLMTILPRSGWSGASGTNKTLWGNGYLWVNAQLRHWVRTLGAVAPLHLVDPFADLSDPANSANFGGAYSILGAAFQDGLHPNQLGAAIIARRAEVDLAGLIATLPGNALRSSGIIDAYAQTQNPWGNALANAGLLTTTGGSISGATATAPSGVPANWTVSQALTGGGAVTASEASLETVAPPTAGFGAQLGRAAQVTVALASGKASISRVGFYQTGISPAGFWTPGRKVVGSARVALSGLAGFVGAEAVLLYTPDGGTTTWQARDGVHSQGYAAAVQEDQTVWLRTPELTVPSNAITNLSVGLYVNLFFDARTSAASGVARIGDLQLRAVE